MIALLVDIGNSRIKWRIARIDASCSTPQWVSEQRAIPSIDSSAIDDAFADDAGVPIDMVWCSNVASDAIERRVRLAVATHWLDVPVHAARPHARQCGVINHYGDPLQLGPDRWLALIGAHAAYPHATLLVCSFGTATTIDLLLSRPDGVHFTGGLILPGVEAMRTALCRDTARLPLASGRVVDFADNTDDAISSGIVHAQLGAVERALTRARRLVGADGGASITCVLAGGWAATIAARLNDLDATVVVVHDLVLRGMVAAASG